MTGVLYGGVQEFWLRTDIIITTYDGLFYFVCSLSLALQLFEKRKYEVLKKKLSINQQL